MDWSIIGGALTQHTLAHHSQHSNTSPRAASLPKAERERWRPIIEHYIFGSEEVVTSHIPDTARGILGSPNQEEATLFKRFVANQLSPGNHSL